MEVKKLDIKITDLSVHPKTEKLYFLKDSFKDVMLSEIQAEK